MKKPVMGIMGGTFDPIHNGHLIIAETVSNLYNMDKVLFIPSGNPPHKQNLKITEKEDRYKMVKYAIEGNEKFSISRIELDRKGKTYTIDTVKELNEIYPEYEKFFIMGEDAFRELKTWKDYEKIFSYTNILIVTRSFNMTMDIHNGFDEFCRKIYVTKTPFIEISSTHIREKVEKNQSIRYLVPKEVEDYIKRKKMYTNIENLNKKLLALAELKNTLKPKRYKHVLGVIDAAKKLSLKWNVDQEKAEMAALFHDFSKNMGFEDMIKYAAENEITFDKIESSNKELMHGKIARDVAYKKYFITDEDILNSIEYHTTGRRGMSKLEKLIFLADYIEPNRSFPGVDKLRDVSFENLDKALVDAIDGTIEHLIKLGEIIHPRTLEARNYLIEELSNQRGE